MVIFVDLMFVDDRLSAKIAKIMSFENLYKCEVLVMFIKAESESTCLMDLSLIVEFHYLPFFVPCSIS